MNPLNKHLDAIEKDNALLKEVLDSILADMKAINAAFEELLEKI